MIQRIVVEGRVGEDLLRRLKDAQGHGGVAAFGRNQLGWVVGREFGKEEEVGGGRGFAQQLDALADEGSDSEEFFKRSVEAGLGEEGLELGAELIDRQGAKVFGVEPDGFRIEGVGFSEINDCVGAVDTFEREEAGELVEGQKLAIVFRGPAEQAEEVDKGLRQFSFRARRFSMYLGTTPRFYFEETRGRGLRGPTFSFRAFVAPADRDQGVSDRSFGGRRQAGVFAW